MDSSAACKHGYKVREDDPSVQACIDREASAARVLVPFTEAAEADADAVRNGWPRFTDYFYFDRTLKEWVFKYADHRIVACCTPDQLGATDARP